MEAVSRWLWSFVADEVKVNQDNPTVTCGDSVLLCSIQLTNRNSKFEDHHENNITVSYSDEYNKAVGDSDCKFKVTKVNHRLLHVTCVARRAGKANVNLDLGKWYRFDRQTLSVEILPSSPKCLQNVAFTCSKKPFDVRYKPSNTNPTMVYRNQWSILKATLEDSYGNVVRGLCKEYSIIALNLSSEEGEEMEIESRKRDIQNGILTVDTKINEAGKYNLSIALSDRKSPEEVFRLRFIPVQVNNAPVYLQGSNFYYPEVCVAGNEIQLEIVLCDIFGCPLPANSTADFNIACHIPNFDAKKETKVLKTTKDESGIVVCFSMVLTKAGSRELVIYDNCNSSKKKVIHIDIHPELNDIHWGFTAVKENAFRREKLISEISLFDRFDNEISSSPNSYSSNIPNLLKQSGPEQWFVKKNIQGNNKATVEFYFEKNGTYSLCLADQDDIIVASTSFSITITDAPLDYGSSSVRWLPEFDDINDQPMFPDDESFRCCLALKDVLGYDYDGKRFTAGCIKMKYKDTETEVCSLSENNGSYNIVVQLTNVAKDDPRPKFWCFVNDKRIENPLVLPRVQVFERYDDGNCILAWSYNSSNIFCQGVTKEDVIGEDYCHLNNIKRFCGMVNNPEIKTVQLVNTDIEFPLDESSGKIKKFQNSLLHLLRALYYRKKAFELDKAREQWKRRATKFYEAGNSACSRFCRTLKTKYAKLMQRYHNEACEEFFQLCNAGRRQSEIDLHGLLVVDEDKLEEYKQRLLSKAKDEKSLDDVVREIEEQRDSGNEAIRKLRERLDEKFDMNVAEEDAEMWLEIIVGSGNHSKGRKRIRPMVEKYLKKRKLEFKPVNKGALVVTFQKYAGKEPCFGPYYCTKCHKTWENGRSWIGKWQACYNCNERRNSIEKCYPLKQRPHRNRQTYIPKIASRNQRPIPRHLQELCQKCTELGRPCPRA
ncbi:uncharacterized protein LOC114520892 [Dendronephthya gigantea]|uniref:uncharacterized protein LOC114520892 n=1 Tax=Dendronephthya gigantea TaxID=151771 RepID=UPI00106A7B2A|nr:uncharacterized protein LOC114520892 [Dendronephthya gigantea]